MQWGDKTLAVEVLCPVDWSPEWLDDKAPLPPFSGEIIEFIDAFSQQVLRHPSARNYPDLIALAYWMRKANLKKIQDPFESTYSGKLLLGRGIVFHIAPSNVDTIFIYSLITSLLAGNVNLIRISQKKTPQVLLLIECLNALLAEEKYRSLSGRMVMLSYGHDLEITKALSSVCDVRVIWGGDETVNLIRSVPLPPRAYDIPFANRYSFCVLSARDVLECSDLEGLVHQFYNDTYVLDQNACSSPRSVFWLGSAVEVKAAQARFWPLLQQYAAQRYPFQPVSAVDKLVQAYSLALQEQGTTIPASSDMVLQRVEVKTPDESIHQTTCAGGFFVECRIDTLDELSRFIKQSDQTMTVFGISKEELRRFLLNTRPMGIDRIVPVGQALDFNINWDGFDLLRWLCREIDLGV